MARTQRTAATRARAGAGAAAAAPGILNERDAARATGLLLATAGVLCVARAALTFAPNMWAWSLNLQRFLSPLWAWLPWALTALSLTPALSRRLLPALVQAGDGLRVHPVVASAVAALSAGALAAALPDQVRYVGDSLLRQATLSNQGVLLEHWYPQALPLDLWLHDTVAHAAMSVAGLTAAAEARWLGALEAAGFGVVAISFARALGLRSAPALVTASVVFFGGYLTMFTGYNKAFSEMCLVVGMLGVVLVRIADGSTGLLPLVTVMAIGLFLHRSMLGALPAALVAGAVVLRRWSAPDWRRPANLLALALAGGSLALALPRIASIVRSIDPMHLAPAAVGREGLLAATFLHARTADMLNLIVMMSPLAIAIPALIVVLGRRMAGDPRARLLVLLAIPFVGALVLVHPGQGIFRDWDDFAATGVALSLLSAWAIGETLRGTSGRSWVAVPLVLSVALPALQWLVQQTDLERGLARARALVTEPPRREGWPETSTWEYLGIRNSAQSRWPEAVAAYREAARLLPSPNILRQLAEAQVQAGDFEGACATYRVLLSRDSNNTMAWLGLAVASFRMQDFAEARRAAMEVLRLDPTNAEARQAITYLDRAKPADRPAAP